jgi:GDP-4-dehydro-6-deoxy-D-mannose reductase
VKILITGIAGFAGSHLTQFLQQLGGYELVGLSLPGPIEDFNRTIGSDAPGVYECDLTDGRQIADIVSAEKPDGVMHLAAYAQVAGSWDNAAAIMEANAVGTQTLMRAVREFTPEARVLLISSGDVYGAVDPESLPLSEDYRLEPNNPYSVSKLAQEYIVRQYHAAFGMEIVTARPFNHIGPRQMGDFIAPVIAKQLAEMEAGLKDPVLELGNLDARRDFLDVRDVVRAYHAIFDKGEAGTAYNVCSGEARQIRDIMTQLVELSDAEPELRRDPKRMRPSDTPVVVGDNTRLRSLGNWQQQYDLKQSLQDVLDYWREQVAARSAAGGKD